MSIEVPEPILDTTYSTELAFSVIGHEIKFTEGYASLTPEQRRWFDRYAAPLLVNEGLETGRAVSRELADNSETLEERLVQEVEVYMQGIQDLQEYYGRA